MSAPKEMHLALATTIIMHQRTTVLKLEKYMHEVELHSVTAPTVSCFSASDLTPSVNTEKSPDLEDRILIG